MWCIRTTCTDVFSGLVRIPNGDTTQEVLKLVFQNEDVVLVSIHSFCIRSLNIKVRVAKPRLNKLGTGHGRKLKERTKTKKSRILPMI